MRACGSSFSFLSIMVCATALYGMVWPAILMEWSVEEDSSLGSGGVGSACFSFSRVLVSFSWACSCAAARKGMKLSNAVAASEARPARLSIWVHSRMDLRIASRRVYTPIEKEVKAAKRILSWLTIIAPPPRFFVCVAGKGLAGVHFVCVAAKGVSDLRVRRLGPVRQGQRRMEG